MQGIYALIDPRTQEVRYIGRSVNIEARYRDHLNKCDKKPYWSARWIRSLQELGLVPQLEILEQVEDRSTLKDREIAWIAYAREQGWKLTNLTDGGDGTLNPSEHHRQAVAEANRKRKFTDEMKARIGEASKGRRHSAETIARCKEAARKPRGPLSDEHKAKLSIFRKGKKDSPETIAKRVQTLLERGHSTKGRKQSAEQRAKTSIATKNAMQNPDIQEKLSEAAKRPKSDKWRASHRAAMQRPEVKEKLRQAARNRKRQKE